VSEQHTPDTDTRTPAPQADDAAPALRLMREEIGRLTEQLRARDGEVAALTTERDSFRVQVETFTRRESEGRLIGKLRAELPHADEVALRGTVALFAEAGKVNRFPKEDELDAAAAAALDLIRKEAPSLTRAAASGGGGVNGAPVAPAAPKNPLSDLFRQIRK
jgi:hypothetical protein